MSAIAPAADNPLVEGLERLPVHPTTLVIFGATGDLARRKLLPALYNLAHEGALPERFFLIGCSRSDKPHEDFRKEAEEAIREFSRRDVDIPDADFAFTRLKHAQAIGDLETLRSHDLPAERVTLSGDDPAAALRELTERLKGLK